MAEKDPMRGRFTEGQRVEIRIRCVLSGTVPRNKKGYTHAVLKSGEGDKYTGEGVLEPGTRGTVLEYVSHGAGFNRDYPLIRVLGKVAVCHDDLFQAI